MEKENAYLPLTDDMYRLFDACQKSGFNEQQAFELTKTYCSVAFVNQALSIVNGERKSMSKSERYELLRKTNAERKSKLDEQEKEK